MAEHQHDPNQAAQFFRPYAPSPYVTHQDIAPMHTNIGRLEQGQESILHAFAGYRAEMLTRMDRIEAMLSVKSDAPAAQSGVVLSLREMMVMAVALVLAGAVLGRLLGVDRLLGAG